MQDRARPALGRPSSFALLLVLLAGPATVFAGNPAAPIAPERVEPRVQKPGDAAGFVLPFEPGTTARIDQGWNSTFSHNGKAAFAYDFGLYVGTPVLAAAHGVVSYVHDGEWACGGPELRNKANLVTIDHPDGSATQYGHLATVGVEVGDVVAPGQVIGLSGMTGYSNCLPHLHFARQEQGSPVTQSVPVYFQGYEDRELKSGELINAPFACGGGPASDEAVATELSTARFCGTYFGGKFEGPALFTRADPGLHIHRDGVGPGGYWLDEATDGYSVRWSAGFTTASWRYTFKVIATGGIRVLVDGTPIVDAWLDRRKALAVSVTRNLGAGRHTIEIERFTTGGLDLLDIDWSPVFAEG